MFAVSLVIALQAYIGTGLAQRAYDVETTFAGVPFGVILTGASQAGIYLLMTVAAFALTKTWGTRALSVSSLRAYYTSIAAFAYPGLLAYILIVVTLGSAHARSASTLVAAIASVLALQWHAWIGNAVGWFSNLWPVTSALQYALCVPFVATLIRRIDSGRYATLPILALLILGIAVRSIVWNGIVSVDPTVAIGRWSDLTQGPTFAYADVLLVGTFVAAVDHRRLRLTFPVILSAFGAFAIVATMVTHAALFESNQVVSRFAWAVILPAASGAFAAGILLDDATLGGLAFPSVRIEAALDYLGPLTFGIYLWHLVFIGSPIPFTRVLPPGIALPVSEFVTFSGALVAAHITFYGVQRPVVLARRERLRRAAA